MFNHVMVGSNDIERSKAFYDTLFAAMGGKPGRIDALGRLVYFHDGGIFMVSRPLDGGPATPANGGTIGFKLDGPQGVQAWHKAGLDAGGTPIEDPPGPRQMPFGEIHLAYLRDPDGNKLCGAFRPAA